jgi:hypothetical protein
MALDNQCLARAQHRGGLILELSYADVAHCRLSSWL